MSLIEELIKLTLISKRVNECVKRIIFLTAGERRRSNEGSTENQQPQIYLFHSVRAQRDDRRMWS